MNKRNSSRCNSSLSKLSLVLNVNGLANSEFNITIKVTPSTQNKEEVVNIPSVTKTEEVLHTPLPQRQRSSELQRLLTLQQLRSLRRRRYLTH